MKIGLRVLLVFAVILTGCVQKGADSVPTPSVSDSAVSADAPTAVSSDKYYIEALSDVRGDATTALESCEKSEYREICLDRIFCEASKYGKSNEMCRLASTDEDVCNEVYSKACSDPSSASMLCAEYFESGDRQDSCRLMVANYANSAGLKDKALKVCGEILSDRRFECLTVIAVADKDLDICKSIIKEPWASRCYYNMALTYKDVGICEYVAEAQLAQSCPLLGKG